MSFCEINEMEGDGGGCWDFLKSRHRECGVRKMGDGMIRGSGKGEGEGGW